MKIFDPKNNNKKVKISSNPLISVCITAYKKEKYIGEAIESVLMQITNFDFEIIITEDRGNDRTLEICNQYQSLHPEKIRVIQNEINLGMTLNMLKGFELSRGKYIAILDADDVWSDPLKLQKQVDFLENNPDYSLVFHDNEYCDQNLNAIDTFKQRFPFRDYEDITLKKLVVWSILGATSSIVFKKIENYPDWAAKTLGTERLIYFVHFFHGKMKYLPDVMFKYRTLPDSWDRDKTKVIAGERNINDYLLYSSVLYPKYRCFFTKKIIWNRFYLMLQYLKIKKPIKALNNFFSLLKECIKYLWYVLFKSKHEDL